MLGVFVSVGSLGEWVSIFVVILVLLVELSPCSKPGVSFSCLGACAFLLLLLGSSCAGGSGVERAAVELRVRT